MLKVLFGDDPNANLNVSMFFNNVYEWAWVENDPLIRDVIKSVDKSEIIDGDTVNSPVLGVIPVTRLSTGTKTLILLKNLDVEEFHADLVTMGNNCLPWLLKIAKDKDIFVSHSGYDITFRDIEEPYEILCLNDNSVIRNAKDWCIKNIEFAEVVHNEGTLLNRSKE